MKAETWKTIRPRTWISLALLVTLVLARWLWPESPAETPATTEVAESGQVHAAESVESRPPVITAQQEEQEQSTEPTALDQYRESTRYPASTRRLSENSMDLLNPGARHEKRRVLPVEDNPGMAWEVLFTADRYFVRGKEPVLVSLQLWNRGEAIVPDHVSMHAEAVGSSGQPARVRLTLQTDGKAKTAVFEPDEHWPDHVGRVRVHAKFSAEALKSQIGVLDFFFTSAARIPAVFTGEFRDWLGDGDLLIDIGLDVRTAGTYRIDGNLFDIAGQPFGWARFEGELQKGHSEATLRYYGLLFHDAQPQGPYTLRNLHGYRMRPGDIPDREHIPELARDYQTSGNYSLEGFRSEENHSPRRQRMIEMYEEAERRGVKLTRPEYTDDG